MKNISKPTKKQVARVLDFLMNSQSDNTAIFIDKHTITFDGDVLSWNEETVSQNGTDFCDLLEKQKGFKFGDEYETKTMKSWSLKFLK